MNRIYQGRISFAELLDSSNQPTTSFDEASLTNQLESPVWQHHVTFQAAVNYYLVALASLADLKNAATARLFRDLHERLRASWEQFPRPNMPGAQSMRDSLQPWLGLSPGATLEQAFGALLENTKASPEARNLALCLLLDRCGGGAAIQ